MPKETKTIRRLTNEEFAKLLFWARDNQIDLQRQVDGGKTIVDIADEKDVAVSTIRSVFDSVGIQHGRETSAAASNGRLFNDLLIVVARMARELNVPHDEIKPYLPVGTEKPANEKK